MSNVRTRKAAKFVVCWAVLCLPFALIGCQEEARTDLRTRPRDLAEAPAEHMGETVTISGEVGRVFTPRAFTVGGREFGRELLIVSTDSIAPVTGRTGEVPVAEQDIVQITGVVKRLDADAFEEEYDTNLPDAVVSEFDGAPFVVALQGTAAMHGVVVSPRLPAAETGVVNDLAMAADPSTQDALRGRVAALPRAPVQDTVQERMFWIGTGEDERVLVVANPESTSDMAGAGAQPRPGEEWMIHGIFRELPAPGMLRTDWGLSDSLIAQLDEHEVYLHALRAEPVDERES